MSTLPVSLNLPTHEAGVVSINVCFFHLAEERLRASYLLLPDPCLYQTLVLYGRCRTHPLRPPAHQTSNKLLQAVSLSLFFFHHVTLHALRSNASCSVFLCSMGRQQCVGFTYRLHGTGSNHRADATVGEVEGEENFCFICPVLQYGVYFHCNKKRFYPNLKVIKKIN